LSTTSIPRWRALPLAGRRRVGGSSHGVRAHAQAEALGYDISIVGLSNADYLLRSVPVLFLPLVVLLVAALALLAAHHHVAAFLTTSRWRLRVLRSLRMAPLWVPALGVASLLVWPVGGYAALPVTLTLGVLGYMYARQLAAAPAGSRAARVLLLCLLVLLLFWVVERSARAFGESYAELVVSRPEQYARVVNYSKDDLEISRRGVSESLVGGDQSAYRFRYEGLRLLNYSNAKYFLLTEDVRSVVLVLPDQPTLRVEFIGP
jgi:hypothetical protein